MGKFVGRDVTLEKDGTKVAALQSKSITINNEAIDVTSDDDDGFMTLLGDSGTRSIEISAEGFVADDTLIAASVGGTALIKEYTINLGTLGTIVGDFRLNEVEVGAEHDEATSISLTIQSTGEFNYTATP